MKDKVSMREAVKFHGHLGPYLILGLRAGELVLKKLKCKKYFGLKVKAYGTTAKPKSCFIDGLQLSTGATYGKGNIMKVNSRRIGLECFNTQDNKKVSLRFKDQLNKLLGKAKTHRDAELLARKLYKTSVARLFTLTAKG